MIIKKWFKTNKVNIKYILLIKQIISTRFLQVKKYSINKKQKIFYYFKNHNLF